MFKHISKTVWILSLVSLLNDTSSEMLYPIIPLYLKEIGYTVFIIGLLEGITECIAGFTKIYTGSLSDTYQRRLPFVQIGYSLSAISRLLMGLFTQLGLIFTARSIDRIGKGIRGSARDALLSDEAQPETMTQVFGFHRSMDTIGAIIGPIIALLFLHFYPKHYKEIFFIAFIPGLISIFLTLFIKEKIKTKKIESTQKIIFHFSYLKRAPKTYLAFIGILFIFTLVNSSDMFLLLKAKETLQDDTNVLYLYIFFNFVYALFSYPIGILADRFKKEYFLILGLIIYALSYFLFAYMHSLLLLILAFSMYGLFYACTQGVIKSILVAFVPKQEKASAIGFYEGITSILLLLANALGGLLYYQLGSQFLFVTISLLSFICAFLLFLFFKKNQNQANTSTTV
ncbi:MAG: MFS transporter [Chitinophagaceae bacterium]